MSIKIYNSYILRNKDFNEVFDFFNEGRKDFVEFAKKNIGMNAVIEYRSLYKKHLTPEQVKFTISKKILNVEKEGLINHKWDFNVTFNIYKIKNAVLLTVNSNNMKLFEHEFEKLKLEEYDYQDKYDKSPVVCQVDWDQRREDWKEAGLIGLEIKKPFIFKMVDWEDYINVFESKFTKKLIEL
jgi:hypothetical protein